MSRPGHPERRARPRRDDHPLAVWLLHRAQVLVASLGRLSRTPVASLMTVAAIGIALALPTGLYLVVSNLERLSGDWNGQPSLSLFLRTEVSDVRARGLAGRLRQDAGIAATRFLSRATALQELEQRAGLGDIQATLGENPLPDVILVRPTAVAATPTGMAGLARRLEALPEVAQVRLDLDWVRRFQGIMALAHQGTLIVGTLLALTVLIVVGNTIRLDIENRREEIMVSKMIGATDGFVRRPFLYSGLWYGLGGALLAWLLLALAIAALNVPVRRLAGLYLSDFSLQGLTPEAALAVLGLGILLGLAGSWLAVGRHLGAIEP